LASRSAQLVLFTFEDQEFTMRRVIAAFLTLLAGPTATQAGGLPILPPGSVVGGRTIAEWGGGWYNWAYNFPAADGDPIIDPTGELAGLYQSPPVFFIAGTYGETGITRSFDVPWGVHLLIPLTNSFTLNFTPDLDPAEVDAARALTDGVDSLFFELNGMSAGDTATLKQYRESVFFIYDAQVPNIWDDPLGQWPNFIDGYWLMLKPLPVGQHTIRFGGGNSSMGFAVEVTAHFRVVPEPSGLVLLGAGVFLTCGYGLVRGRAAVGRGRGSGALCEGDRSQAGGEESQGESGGDGGGGRSREGRRIRVHS
jgi:hypothetical protein